MDFIKIKNFSASKITIKNEKQQFGRKYLQTTSLVKELYTEYVNSTAQQYENNSI